MKNIFFGLAFFLSVFVGLAAAPTVLQNGAVVSNGLRVVTGAISGSASGISNVPGNKVNFAPGANISAYTNPVTGQVQWYIPNEMFTTNGIGGTNASGGIGAINTSQLATNAGVLSLLDGGLLPPMNAAALTNIPTSALQSNITISAGSGISISLQGGTNAVISTTNSWYLPFYNTFYTNGSAYGMLFITVTHTLDTGAGPIQTTYLNVSNDNLTTTNIIDQWMTISGSGTDGTVLTKTLSGVLQPGIIWWINQQFPSGPEVSSVVAVVFK